MKDRRLNCRDTKMASDFHRKSANDVFLSANGLWEETAVLQTIVLYRQIWCIQFRSSGGILCPIKL